MSPQKRHKRSSHSGVTTALVSVFSLAVLIPFTLFAAGVICFQTLTLTLPGVYVDDLDVGLLSIDDTSRLINQEWNINRQIKVMAPDDPSAVEWLTPLELGLWIDPEATAQEAYKIGRSSRPLDDIKSALRGDRQIVSPVLYFNESIARETLTAFEERFSLQAKDASLSFTDGAWVASPSEAGQQLDIEAVLSQLNQHTFEILQKESLILHLEPVSPKIQDLTPILGEIESILQQEIRLEAYDAITDETFVWSIPTDIKREWVHVDPETFSVFLDFNDQNIEQILSLWETDLGNGRFLQRPDDMSMIAQHWNDNQAYQTPILHAPSTYSVKPGESLWSISLKIGMPLWYILDANPGVSINDLAAGTTLDIPSKNVLLPLPPIQNKRIVVDISEQRMTVYENGKVIRSHIISTGIADSPTMAGVFQVQTHEINAYASNWDLYMPHFMGIYEAWPGFMNGIHGLPRLSNGQRLWAGNLGSPVSYGCIVMDLSAAEALYYWAEPGVIVEITR